MTGLELQLKRRALGLTQDLLAKELGVSRPTISSWEKADSPPNARLISLALTALEKLPELRNWHRDGAYAPRGKDDV